MLSKGIVGYAGIDETFSNVLKIVPVGQELDIHPKEASLFPQIGEGPSPHHLHTRKDDQFELKSKDDEITLESKIAARSSRVEGAVVALGDREVREDEAEWRQSSTLPSDGNVSTSRTKKAIVSGVDVNSFQGDFRDGEGGAGASRFEVKGNGNGGGRVSSSYAGVYALEMGAVREEIRAEMEREERSDHRVPELKVCGKPLSAHPQCR